MSASKKSVQERNKRIVSQIASAVKPEEGFHRTIPFTNEDVPKFLKWYQKANEQARKKIVMVE
jgi:ABC-type uncharacterized transport system auxiliary subunit